MRSSSSLDLLNSTMIPRPPSLMTPSTFSSTEQRLAYALHTARCSCRSLPRARECRIGMPPSPMITWWVESFSERLAMMLTAMRRMSCSSDLARRMIVGQPMSARIAAWVSSLLPARVLMVQRAPFWASRFLYLSMLLRCLKPSPATPISLSAFSRLARKASASARTVGCSWSSSVRSDSRPASSAYIRCSSETSVALSNMLERFLTPGRRSVLSFIVPTPRLAIFSCR
mmetsp:Transcript_19882/g.76188  ORF Transcript_19882/g.76188 Transcript_19882/m.76188 type:complete len:229 (+) Transcript_19882:692-1378(+)